MPEELTADSTQEDIEKYVDEVVANVEAERAGETDGGKLAADSDKTLGTVEEQSEETAEAETAKGEEPGGSDWLDDDLKAELAAYGINEEGLDDFASREELERALRFFDKTALDAGRKAMAESEEKARDAQGKFTKGEPKEEIKIEPKDGQYEITLDKDAYDEELVEEFARMRDHYESRLDALESRFLEADARAEEQHFDSIVDSLGHADLFGKTGKENAKQLQRREDLLIASKAQQLGLKQLGREVDLDESLVNRVARMVFAEDLGKKDLKSRTRKVAKQSDGRMGGGATRPSDAPETVQDEMRRLYKELEGA